MRKAIRQEPKFFHEPCDAIQHRIDLPTQSIEGIARPGKRNALGEISCTDAISDRSNLTYALSDVVREYDAAEEAKQNRDGKRNEHRPFQRFPDCIALAGNAAACQPLAGWKLVDHDRCNVRRRLPFEADKSVVISFLPRKVGWWPRFKIADGFLSCRFDDCDNGLGVAISDGIFDRIVESASASRAVHVGENLGLFRHLLPNRNHGIIVGAVIDESNDGEVRKECKQARYQGYA
jgi:hypothetical protein